MTPQQEEITQPVKSPWKPGRNLTRENLQTSVESRNTVHDLITSFRITTYSDPQTCTGDAVMEGNKHILATTVLVQF